jgi:hypothetical protein
LGIRPKTGWLSSHLGTSSFGSVYLPASVPQALGAQWIGGGTAASPAANPAARPTWSGWTKLHLYEGDTDIDTVTRKCVTYLKI